MSQAKEQAKVNSGQAPRPETLNNNNNSNYNSETLKVLTTDDYTLSAGFRATGVKYATNANSTRLPWVLTCQSWLDQDPQKIIFFNVNPNSVNWNMPLRASVVNQRMGKVIHIWRNKIRGTYFDEYKLNITFQSGSVLTVKDYKTKDIKIAQGLTNFYTFLELMDEPKILDSGKINTVYLTYRSQLFPDLLLKGFFDPQSLSFTDNTSTSAMVDSWSSTFIVMDSFPKIKAENIKTMIKLISDSEDDIIRSNILNREIVI